MAKIHQHPAHGARIVGSVCILITCLSHGCHHWVSFDTEKKYYICLISYLRLALIVISKIDIRY